MKKEEIKSKLLNLENKLDSHRRHNIKNKKFNMPVMIITELFAGIIVGATNAYLSRFLICHCLSCRLWVDHPMTYFQSC
mgnify:CR=1 FL=1